jgi:hypothetical protein
MGDKLSKLDEILDRANRELEERVTQAFHKRCGCMSLIFGSDGVRHAHNWKDEADFRATIRRLVEKWDEEERARKVH